MTLAINFHYRSLSQGPSLFLAGQKTVSRDKNDNTGQKTISRDKKRYRGTIYVTQSLNTNRTGMLHAAENVEPNLTSSSSLFTQTIRAVIEAAG